MGRAPLGGAWLCVRGGPVVRQGGPVRAESFFGVMRFLK